MIKVGGMLPDVGKTELKMLDTNSIFIIRRDYEWIAIIFGVILY